TYSPHIFFFSSRRRHTSFSRDWSSDVCSSDLAIARQRKSLQRLQPVTNAGRRITIDYFADICRIVHRNPKKKVSKINEETIFIFGFKKIYLYIKTEKSDKL